MRRRMMAGRYHVARPGHHIAVRGQSFEADHVPRRLCVGCHALPPACGPSASSISILAAILSNPAAIRSWADDRLSPVTAISQLATTGHARFRITLSIDKPLRLTLEHLASAAPGKAKLRGPSDPTGGRRCRPFWEPR